MIKKIQFILTSGLLFSAPLSALADTTITTPTATAVSYLTSIFGNITIAPTGSLTTNTALTDTIIIDTPSTSVITDPNNTNPLAISSSTGSAIRAVNTNSVITIGANSTISGGGAIGAIVVAVGGAGATIENNGTILATVNGIDVSSGISSITNTGTILSGGPGIFIEMGGDVINGINNTGVIQTTGAAATIDIAIGGVLSGGLTNSGTITTGGTLAIDFSDSASNILFTNNAPGVVNGNIFLSKNISSSVALQMNGGTINGTVFTVSGAGPRILNVAGGTIVGGINMGAFSNQADVINQSGGTIGNIVGNPAFNQSLNITGTVTTGGSITNVNNVNVQANGNFTVNNPIINAQNVTVTSGILNNNNTIGTNTVSVNSGGIFNNNDLVNANLVTVNSGGTFNNNGQLNTTNLTINAGGLFSAEPSGMANVSNTLTNNGTLSLKVPVPGSNPNVTTAFYVQPNSALLEVAIQDKSNFGHMNITGPGVTNIAGDLLKVTLTNTGLIRNLDTFNIIHNTGAGTIVGEFDILQPSSASISFIQVNTPTDVILEAIRKPFADIVGTDEISRPPAISIDAILASGQPLSPTFQSFIIALDGLNQEGVDAGLRTAVPQFDGGLVDLSHRFQNNVFEGLGKYIDEHRPITSLIPGYVAGDVGWGRWDEFEYSRGDWAKVFATRAVQNSNHLSQGYDLEDIGVILGYDQYCSERVVLGGALSYATGTVNTKDPSKDSQSAKSFQITAYSTYDYKGPGYLDVMTALAFNQYDTTRNILAGSFVATSTAEFSAWNYGVNLETGYRFVYGKYHIIPVARALYSRLRIDNYTEEGADGLSLSVLNEPVEQGITAVGIKFNSTNFYRRSSYVSELRFNIIYDWINDGQSMVSNFLEGGPPFITNAFRPHPCTYNLGLSLTALACENTVFVINYDLDLRRDYSAQNLSMKLRYEW